MLQQAPTVGPFMRQFVCLREITFGASQHNIVADVQSTTRQRYNVIDVIGFAELTLAVITKSALARKLHCYVLFGINTVNSLLASLSVNIPSLAGRWIHSCVFSLSLAHALRVSLPIQNIVTLSLLWMRLFVSVIVGFLFLWILLAKRTTGFSTAVFAAWIQFLSVSVQIEIVRCFQLKFAAFCAALEEIGEIKHSVSLSLSRWLTSASGASVRLSGISLADIHIIAQGGQIYHA